MPKVKHPVIRWDEVLGLTDVELVFHSSGGVVFRGPVDDIVQEDTHVRFNLKWVASPSSDGHGWVGTEDTGFGKFAISTTILHRVELGKIRLIGPDFISAHILPSDWHDKLRPIHVTGLV